MIVSSSANKEVIAEYPHSRYAAYIQFGLADVELRRERWKNSKFCEGAIAPFDGKPPKMGRFGAVWRLSGLSGPEIGLTKKGVAVQNTCVFVNNKPYPGKDASMHKPNLFSIFW